MPNARIVLFFNNLESWYKYR